jgi:glucuronate isomerase
MPHDPLAETLFEEIRAIPIVDPHSHIDPQRPASKSLDDILGYHYYTELAHSVGIDRALVADSVPPRQRVRTILDAMSRFDNTTQAAWFRHLCRALFGWDRECVTAADADALFDHAEAAMARPDWEDQVLAKANIEKVFLTNDFDDPLENFDATRYVPCLRTDDLVFRLDNEMVRARFAKATGYDARELMGLRRGVAMLFEHFTRRGAKACAISLPPDFSPARVANSELEEALARPSDEDRCIARSCGVFWLLAEACRNFRLPFDLMIGVNRRVYETGVFQGQDLFDQRTSLIQYRRLFNDFPEVTFCVSVLTSSQNQELASYSWIFPNVVTSGHWWYSNIPVYVERDARARLESVPKTKQIGYYSDMYKLEFGLPKFDMYRRVLAKVLAEHFVRPGLQTQEQAIALARLLLRENAQRIFCL